MMNLYCFHSPERSSVGFQRAGWSLSDGGLTKLEPGSASKEVWTALLDGVADALCFDTERHTRAFVMRGVHIRRSNLNGWHLNFALETDAESYPAWANLVAAFLTEYADTTQKFAALFSVDYSGGEHYLLDQEGFLRLLEDAVQAKTIQKIPQNAALRPLATLLAAPFQPVPGRLLLLVPSVTRTYFAEHTSLKGLSKPTLCIGHERWLAALEHRELPPETKEPAEDLSDDLLDLVVASAAVLGGALAVYGVCSALRRSKHKKDRRRK